MMLAKVAVGLMGGGPMNGRPSNPSMGPGGGRGPPPEGGIGTLTTMCVGRPGVSMSSVKKNGLGGSGVPPGEEAPDGAVARGGRMGLPGVSGFTPAGVTGGTACDRGGVAVGAAVLLETVAGGFDTAGLVSIGV